MTRITTNEIRIALELTLKEFELHGAKTWEVNEEFYWDVPTASRYDSYDSPEKLTMGQLSEDIRRVQEIAAGSADPAPSCLVWIATILRLAGERGPYSLCSSKAEEPSMS